jgi:hypothetical protein
MKNIHILPTDKPSRLLVRNDKPFVLMLKEHSPFATNKTHTNQHIYITSDEEIKEGDWFYNTFNDNQPKLQKRKGDWRTCFNQHKIILTTDRDLIKDGVQAIDDEFLEWFVKNPSCDKVEVDIFPKNTNKLYGIIIPQEEPKEEIWKDIPNYEGLYQVSNFGNVKSLERYVKGKIENRLQKENILSKRLVGNLGNQYYAVTLCNNKDRKQIKVSVLVAMAFLNHTPNGYVGFTVDHIDNNPLNNNVDNLQVITKRENSSKDRKGISKYTGVTFNKKSNKWRSQIWINGKNKTLGSFDDELEAHRAYQKELQQHLKS